MIFRRFSKVIALILVFFLLSGFGTNWKKLYFEKTEEIKGLQTQIDSLKKQREDLRVEKARLEEANEDLRNRKPGDIEKEALRKREENLVKGEQKIEEDRQKLEREKEISYKEQRNVGKLIGENEGLQSQKENLDSRIKQLKSEKENLETDISKKQSWKDIWKTTAFIFIGFTLALIAYFISFPVLLSRWRESNLADQQQPRSIDISVTEEPENQLSSSEEEEQRSLSASQEST